VRTRGVLPPRSPNVAGLHLLGLHLRPPPFPASFQLHCRKKEARVAYKRPHLQNQNSGASAIGFCRSVLYLCYFWGLLLCGWPHVWMATDVWPCGGQPGPAPEGAGAEPPPLVMPVLHRAAGTGPGREHGALREPTGSKS
jgi:hypothetical protein